MSVKQTLPPEAKAVLDFWFVESGPEKWFVKDEAFDGEIRDRFGSVYRRAYDGEVGDWIETAEGCLALVIVLDQFPRNMFRDDPRAFGTDAHARILLQHALGMDYDKAAGRAAKAIPVHAAAA